MDVFLPIGLIGSWRIAAVDLPVSRIKIISGVKSHSQHTPNADDGQLLDG